MGGAGGSAERVGLPARLVHGVVGTLYGYLLVGVLFVCDFEVPAGSGDVSGRTVTGSIQHDLLILGALALAFFGGEVIAVVLHELGHLLVGRPFGAVCREIYLGAPPALVSIPLGRVRLHLGVRGRGRVVWSQWPSKRGRVPTTLAGPVANLLVAAVLLFLIPLPIQYRLLLAASSGLTGVMNLLPFRTRKGTLTDGVRLFIPKVRRGLAVDLKQVAAEEAWSQPPKVVDGLLYVHRLGYPEVRRYFPVLAFILKETGRTDDLLGLYTELRAFREGSTESWRGGFHTVIWNMLLVPGLPDETVHRLAQDVEWLLDQAETPPTGMRHTLAVARLRQGRLDDVEPLCAEELPGLEDPGMRATVLATVAMARGRLGGDADTPLREAQRLDVSAPLVAEAREALAVRQV